MTLCLEEVEENIHGWRMAKVDAKNGKGPQKGPAVGVQLGRGHVDFNQKSALKPCEWEAKLKPLEDSRVHKE